MLNCTSKLEPGKRILSGCNEEEAESTNQRHTQGGESEATSGRDWHLRQNHLSQQCGKVLCIPFFRPFLFKVKVISPCWFDIAKLHFYFIHLIFLLHFLIFQHGYTYSYFTLRHNRSMKMSSKARPRLSILIFISLIINKLTYSFEVN